MLQIDSQRSGLFLLLGSILGRHLRVNANPDISRVWFVHGKDIRGAAVVPYRNPLITQHMDEPDSLRRVKIK